jgi:pyruvate formate lyase activating enzyme
VNTDKEFNLENDSPIYDITKFTHLDYPEHLAAIIWFSGCNMRCDYCYNRDIVFAKKGTITMHEALEFLRSRIGLLDGVVLSGGEATAHELVAFCQAIKEMGFAIKLDTNGTNSQELYKLLNLDLLDYVALDYKAPQDKFTHITHSRRYDEFSKSLDMLIASGVAFEVRTTLHADLLSPADINTIIQDLENRGYTNSYYIQEFVETKTNIAALKKATQSFDKAALISKLDIIWR